MLLGRAVNRHFLDDKRQLRTALKGTATTLPVHFHDQALFDAVDAVRRHIEAAMARTNVKAKVFARFEGDKRHHAFWLLHACGRIGLVLGGKAAVANFDVAPADRRTGGVAPRSWPAQGHGLRGRTLAPDRDGSRAARRPQGAAS